MSTAHIQTSELLGVPSSDPTTHACVAFRSRLEARWAAFFDGMNWSWEYETARLYGYVPDFILSFGSGSVLFEVQLAKTLAKLAANAHRIVASGWPADFVIVGSKLFDPDTFTDGASLGLYFQRIDAPQGELRPAEPAQAVVQTCRSCGMRSFFHERGAWRCAVSGCHDGNRFLDPSPKSDVEEWWRAAGTRVQRMPKRERGGRLP